MRSAVIRRNFLAFAAGAALAALAAADASAQGRVYKIIGVGDVMMGSDYPQPIMDPRVTPGADPAAMLGAPLARLLKEADVTFGNYEGTMHALQGGAKLCRNPTQCYVFRSPPFHAEVLRRVGFNLMSTATMARMGRVEGNYMSRVATSNKKLVDCLQPDRRAVLEIIGTK